MKNKEVIKAFIDSNGKWFQGSIIGSNLEYAGHGLYSYGVCIARFKDGILYINTEKYSQMTSKHQNLLQSMVQLDQRYINRIEYVLGARAFPAEAPLYYE